MKIEVKQNPEKDQLNLQNEELLQSLKTGQFASGAADLIFTRDRSDKDLLIVFSDGGLLSTYDHKWCADKLLEKGTQIVLTV